MCVHTLAHVQYILILLSAKIQSQVQETKYKLVWPYWHLMYAYPESLDLTQRHVPFLVQYIYACRLQCLLQFILWQGMFHFENERFEDKYRLLPGSRDLVAYNVQQLTSLEETGNSAVLTLSNSQLVVTLIAS